MTIVLGIALVGVTAVLLGLLGRHITLRREAHIREFDLPRGLFAALQKRRPELTVKDCQLVAHALRQFFLAHLKSGCKYVSMPSQVVDDLWHEFILHTKSYQQFCQRAFGQFLHHAPAVALRSNVQGDAGLRVVWWHACREEHINPLRASRLPLLFAIDAKLKIVDGFHYVVDCDRARRLQQNSEPPPGGVVYCGGHLAPSDGGTASSADAGDSSDSSGDGGGCGGGGK